MKKRELSEKMQEYSRNQVQDAGLYIGLEPAFGEPEKVLFCFFLEVLAPHLCFSLNIYLIFLSKTPYLSY